MRTVLLSVFLIAIANCGMAPELTCQTTCGLTLDAVYEGPESLWTCASLQAAETRALQEFARHVSPRAPGFENPALFCVRLAGYTVQPMPAREMEAKHRQAVSGATSCRARSINLTNTAPSSSALTHELAHVIQGCAHGHAEWTAYGIDAAVESAWE